MLDNFTELVKRIRVAIEPDRIILFGSRARGTASPYSDFDVLVIASNETHRRNATVAIYKALAGFKLPVDIVVATNEDISRLGSCSAYVYKSALQEGVQLYAA